MEKKKSSLFTILFGLAFIVLGVFLLLNQKESPVIMLVSGLDILFGIALIGGSALGKFTKNSAPASEMFEEDTPCSEPDTAPFAEEAATVQDPVQDSVSEEAPKDEPAAMDIPSDPAQLAAREAELRIAAKRATDEAARAKKTATLAVQEAKQAEDELSRAEAELAGMDAAEQRAAMRRIDALAQTAAEKSEIAINEAQRAKLAIRNAREAAELHSMAMDAAASAISGDDEFADFN